MNGIITATLLGLFAFATIGQAADTDLNAEARALAERLLVSMDIQKTMDKSFAMVDQLTAGLGGAGEASQSEAVKAVQDLLRKELSWDKLKDDYIAMYIETFSAEELRGLVEFYKSPVGKKWVEKQPILMERSMMLSQKKMMAVMPGIDTLTEQVLQELKENR